MIYVHGHHDQHCLQALNTVGLPSPVKTIYCVGDNVCTDIFGANLYNKYLQRRRIDTAMMTQAKVQVRALMKETVILSHLSRILAPGVLIT